MSLLSQLIAKGSNASRREQSACNWQEPLMIEKGPILPLPLARRIAALRQLPTLRPGGRYCNT
jgi:hypothetical protein